MAETDRGPEERDDGVPQIVETPGVLGGDPRIAGTRIGVFHVYQRHVEGGEAPETIATGFDVSLAAVHAALAYGFSNRDEMESIAERNRTVRENATGRIRPDDAE